MSLNSPYTTKIERGAYSAIVYKEGDLCVAEDNVGTIIKEDINAAITIQAAIDALDTGKLVIAKADYTISTANINIDTSIHRISLSGEGFGGYNTTDEGTRLLFSNGYGIYYTGNGWMSKLSDLALIGDGTGAAISNDVPSGNFNKCTFDTIKIRNFAKGIDLQKTISCKFRNIYMRDVAQGVLITNDPWNPYLDNVQIAGTCTEGIYISFVEKATLNSCDGGTASTFGFRLSGNGITVTAPYTENGVKMELKGTGITVIGGLVHGEVVIGFNGNSHNIKLINMVSYSNRNTISFTVNASYDSHGIVIDRGIWTPTVTDVNNHAIIENFGLSGVDEYYKNISGGGYKFEDLLALPTSLPTYGLRAGTTYFIAATNTLYIYNGSAWKSITLT